LADEKAVIMDTIQRAQELCPERRMTDLLTDLGLPKATYYRWLERAAAGQLADRVVVPQRQAVPPTPAEVGVVLDFAYRHPLLGYKRLAYALMAENKAFVRPWMVYGILGEADLLGRRAPAPELLVRPPEADHPDQRWHTDLMMWLFGGQWFWLIDVLDAYSRYLVQWELLLTAKADDVVRAAQRAVDTLHDRLRRPGEPEIVHDGGPQFIGHEWQQFIQATGTTDVRTHPYHPQSNGRDERVHRTFREEIPLDENALLYEARTAIAEYSVYYNHQRPHSALHYLCPHDYYRGDPAMLLAEREAKLHAAAEARRTYWEQQH
jgi:transposase InsO family protein